MLSDKNTALVVIDVQEKLSRVMYQKERLFENLRKLISGIKVLGIPVLLTEQNPEGLGRTIPEMAELLADVPPLPKFCFSCWGDERFTHRVEGLGHRSILLCGIETHVCVYQTAMDLLGAGYEVQVVADAVSSRTAANYTIGLERMKDEGVVITSTEMVLFELLKVARGLKFKEILKIVK